LWYNADGARQFYGKHKARKENIVLLNKYSVRVIGGNETPGGYIELRHSQTYQLQLRNDNPLRCDARVEVDGQHVGTWRLNPFSTATLERPAHDEGKFTFYKAGTQEAALAHLVTDDANLGLIQVTFTPEQKQESVSLSYTMTSGASWRGIPDTYTANVTSSIGETKSISASYRSAGGTGLSGHSNQNYGNASEIQYDYSGQTVIYLRLVCAENEGPRPLTQRSNPVPPPVR
jgi:hypothetical protein